MTIRSQIIDALVTVYGGDSAVVRAPVQLFYDELAGLDDGTVTGIWTPEPEDTEKVEYRRYDCELPVRIERIKTLEPAGDWRARIAARQAAAETLLGEIIAIGAAAHKTLNGLCLFVDYSGGNVLVPDEQKNAVGAFVVWRVKYQFLTTDPNT